jgi:type IV pilus assembly protein PilV
MLSPVRQEIQMSKTCLFEQRPGTRQDGLTLIEILVTLLVLSVGLAGIAVLHINSMKFAHASYYRSIASSAALDFEERLWIAQRQAGSTCFDADTVNTIALAIQNQWGATGPGQIAIPGLTAEATHELGSAGIDNWVQATLAVEWVDSRFVGDDNTALVERFEYTTRVICPEPPPPPEE